MNTQILNGNLNKIRTETERLENDIYALLRADMKLYPENFGQAAVEAALRSEKITCELRIVAGLVPTKVPYLTSAAEVMDISIHTEGEILKVMLPCLLPRRKTRTSPDFLLLPLYAALQKYAMTHMIPHYDRYTLCLRHIYDAALGTGYIRDYDNIEIKPVIDAITLYFMPDDSGFCCDLYHTTGTGSHRCTELYLMDTTLFPAWLAQQKCL